MAKKEYTRYECSIMLADRTTWVTMRLYCENGKTLPTEEFAVRVGEPSQNVNPTTGEVTMQILLQGEVMFGHPLLSYYEGLDLHSVTLPDGKFHLCRVGSPVDYKGAVAALLA
jgi:hypothetical protein